MYEMLFLKCFSVFDPFQVGLDVNDCNWMVQSVGSQCCRLWKSLSNNTPESRRQRVLRHPLAGGEMEILKPQLGQTCHYLNAVFGSVFINIDWGLATQISAFANFIKVSMDLGLYAKDFRKLSMAAYIRCCWK